MRQAKFILMQILQWRFLCGDAYSGGIYDMTCNLFICNTAWLMLLTGFLLNWIQSDRYSLLTQSGPNVTQYVLRYISNACGKQHTTPTCVCNSIRKRCSVLRTWRSKIWVFKQTLVSSNNVLNENERLTWILLSFEKTVIFVNYQFFFFFSSIRSELLSATNKGFFISIIHYLAALHWQHHLNIKILTSSPGVTPLPAAISGADEGLGIYRCSLSWYVDGKRHYMPTIPRVNILGTDIGEDRNGTRSLSGGLRESVCKLNRHLQARI